MLKGGLFDSEIKIKKAVESKGQYISKYFVPKAIDFVEDWFCKLYKSYSPLTQKEAQDLLSELTEDFLDIFIRSQQVQPPSHGAQQSDSQCTDLNQVLLTRLLLPSVHNPVL